MNQGNRPLIIILGPKHSGKSSAGKALARLWEEGGTVRDSGAAQDDEAARDGENGGTAPEDGAAPGNRKPPQAARFIDLDELVEEREGKSPRLLYREGPEVFRGAEAEALGALLEGNPRAWKIAGDPQKDPAGNPAAAVTAAGDPAGGLTIVAAGGGLADNQEALEILKKSPRAPTVYSVYTVYIEVSVETAWERIRAAADRTGELPPFLDTENPRETHRQLHERRARVYRELAEITVQAGNTPEETAAKILLELRKLKHPRFTNIKTVKLK